MCVCPSSVTLFPKLYLDLMSSGRWLYFTFVNFARCIGDAKKKSLMSAVKKRAPFFASEMIYQDLEFEHIRGW